MDGPDLLALCERLAERAQGRGADDAEVYWSTGSSVEVDVEANRVAGSGTSQSQGGSIRVVKDGRVGFAYLSDASVADAAIERAIAQTAIGPGKGYALPDGGTVEPLGGRWDDALHALDVGRVVDAAHAMIAGAREACPDADVSGGGVGMNWGIEAIASTRGVAAWDGATGFSAGASLVLKEGESAISNWESKTIHTGDLDAAGIGERAGTTAKELRNPQTAEAGTKDIILLPDAASELITNFVEGAVDGDEAMRERSVWSSALGETVAHAGLSMHDEPRFEGGIGTCTMDGEGLPAKTLKILDEGRLRSFLFDSWTAQQHGQKTTHNAVRGDFKTGPSVGVHHWHVHHQNTLTQDALIAGVDDGYLIESVLGAHTANATTGDFSVTSPNVWRIKGGALAGAAKEIAVGGNLPSLLQRLDAASDAPKHSNGSVVPALRLRDVQISV